MRIDLKPMLLLCGALLWPISGLAGQGTIVGRVTETAGGAGLEGVSVQIQGTNQGGLTITGGRYIIRGVPAGTHTVVAERIGFATTRAQVTVREGETAVLDLELSEEAIALDEVVVTGTMSETRVRELPSPITTITARDIEKLGIQRPDQLFRGTVPGAVTFEQGPYNYYASVTMRGKNSLYFDYVKTYIDGVEVTNPLYISTIDPASIERVEVIRGPQASTIYGADASGGVVQIFTKKGRKTARPTIRIQSAVGMISNEWGVEKTPFQTDNMVTVFGGGDGFSYNLGGSYFHYGEFVPEAYTDNYSLFGGVNVEHGPLRAELTGRYYLKDFGWPQNPILRDLGYSLWQVPRYEQNYVRQEMVGLNLRYAVTDNWSHQLVLGYDASNYEYYNWRSRLATPDDTTFVVAYSPAEKNSLRYNTALHLELSEKLNTTLTAGLDHTSFGQGGFYASAVDTSFGYLEPEEGSVARLNHNRYANTGLFIQDQFGILDRLFLTAGVRLEINDNFGEDYGNAVAPRLGAAYAFETSGAQAKVRAAWGSGIKPPLPQHKGGLVSGGTTYLANPDIGPEEIRGWDAGIEIAVPNRGAFNVTYYDQEAIDLIEGVLLSAADREYQYQNVGTISNTGWEFEGEVYLSPFTLRGTFTTMKSIMAERAPGYAGDVEIGESMLEVPEWSGGVTATYAHPRGSVSLSSTLVGPWVYYDWIALYGYYYGGHDYRGSQRDYWMNYDSVVKFGLTADAAITNELEAFMTVDNLTNQLGERHNTNTDTPRAAMIGFRYTY